MVHMVYGWNQRHLFVFIFAVNNCFFLSFFYHVVLSLLSLNVFEYPFGNSRLSFISKLWVLNKPSLSLASFSIPCKKLGYTKRVGWNNKGRIFWLQMEINAMLMRAEFCPFNRLPIYPYRGDTKVFNVVIQTD